MAAELLTDRRGSTLVLTLSDPSTRNALGPQLYVAGLAALEQAQADDTVRAVVLTGAGGHFSAGGNLNQLQAVRGQPQAQAARIDALHRWVLALQRCSRPVIAAVEGAAAGAGCSLALGCDLVVASREARFTLAYGRIGATPDGGATWQLARALPRQQALEWIWLAQTRTAHQLQQAGLVNRLCEPGQALDAALALAGELSACAPNAVAAVKDLVAEAGDAPLHEQLDREREAFIAAVNHDNGGEGLAAWQERRSARFR